MKQLTRAIGISVLTVLALARPSLAQRTIALAVGGGAAVPVGKLRDTNTTGYNAILGLAIGVAELPIGFRFDGIYNNFLHNKTVPPAGSSASHDLRVIGGLGNLIYAFPGSIAKPYIIAGGGLYSTKSDTTGAKSDNIFGFNAGLGITFGLGPFVTFLESRYHSIPRKVSKGGAIHFVPITVGLMF